MPFLALVIGALLIVVAFMGTQGQLATALTQDIPKFFVWAAAIGIIVGLGYIPGLGKPTRWLLGLVALVVVLTNYQKIIQGFSSFAGTAGQQATAQDASQEQATQQQQTSQVTAAEQQFAQLTGTQGASNAVAQVAQSAGTSLLIGALSS